MPQFSDDQWAMVVYERPKHFLSQEKIWQVWQQQFLKFTWRTDAPPKSASKIGGCYAFSPNIQIQILQTDLHIFP